VDAVSLDSLPPTRKRSTNGVVGSYGRRSGSFGLGLRSRDAGERSQEHRVNKPLSQHFRSMTRL